jgi:hypothetical protein
VYNYVLAISWRNIIAPLRLTQIQPMPKVLSLSC